MSDVSLISIGFGNMVSSKRIISIVAPDSAPVKRLIQDAREHHLLIDASCGRKTRAVLIMDSGHVVLSALLSETIARRLNAEWSETESE